MEDEIDIHNFSSKLTQMRKFIGQRGVSSVSRAKKAITQENAKLILEYDTARSLERIKPPTRIVDMNRLLEAARVLEKDFDKANKNEIKTMIATIDEKHSIWTRTKIRMTFKRFYKWMRYGDDYFSMPKDEFPEEVRWICAFDGFWMVRLRWSK